MVEHYEDSENQELDYFFKEQLGKLDPQYNEAAWAGLEAQLDKVVFPIKPSNPRVIPFYQKSWFIGVAASLLLILMSLGILYGKSGAKNESQNPVVTDGQMQKEVEKQTLPSTSSQSSQDQNPVALEV